MNSKNTIRLAFAALSMLILHFDTRAQCNPSIGATVNVIDTNSPLSIDTSFSLIDSAVIIGNGGSAYWICMTETVISNGGTNVFFVESNGVLIGGGGDLTVYLKNCASFEAAGGGGNLIYYEPNSNIINAGGSATLIPCSSITFDYTNAPTGVCDSTDCDFAGIDGLTLPQQKEISIYPNPMGVSSFIAFENPTNETFTLTLYNSMGKKVRVVTNISGQKDEIERGDLLSGFYFYEIRNKDNYLSSGKLVLE